MQKIFRFAVALVLAGGAGLSAFGAQAEVQTKTIEYKDGDTVLKGVLAWDDAMSGKQPGVLVVHEWWGLNDYAKSRAEALAVLRATLPVLEGSGSLRLRLEVGHRRVGWTGTVARLEALHGLFESPATAERPARKPVPSAAFFQTPHANRVHRLASATRRAAHGQLLINYCVPRNRDAENDR